MTDKTQAEAPNSLHSVTELVLLLRGSRAALWRIAKARSTVRATKLRQMAEEALLIPQRLERVTKEIKAARVILSQRKFILDDAEFDIAKRAFKPKRR